MLKNADFRLIFFCCLVLTFSFCGKEPDDLDTLDTPNTSINSSDNQTESEFFINFTIFNQVNYSNAVYLNGELIGFIESSKGECSTASMTIPFSQPQGEYDVYYLNFGLENTSLDRVDLAGTLELAETCFMTNGEDEASYFFTTFEIYIINESRVTTSPYCNEEVDVGDNC